MEPSPVTETEETEGVRRPAKGARVLAENARRVSGAKRRRARPTVLTPGRSPILRTSPSATALRSPLAISTSPFFRSLLLHNDLIALSKSCSNLRSISLWLTPSFYDFYMCTTSFTDDSLKALALNCSMLQTVELTFGGCEYAYPSEIGFTRKGLVMLMKSCPIRVLVLNGANFFDDKGMKALSFAPFLETLELIDCKAVTDIGMRFIVHIPSLSNLALRWCEHVTDGGMAELVQASKLESLSIECCCQISREAVQGAARSVHYCIECVSHSLLGKRLFLKCS